MTLSLGLRLATITATTAAGAVWLAWRGPFPIVIGSTPTEEPSPYWYMVLAFPLLGMLVADGLDLLRARSWWRVADLAAEITFAVGLSTFRLALAIPISGHALLASLFVARRLLLWEVHTWRMRVELVFGVATLVVVAVIKLGRWADPVTLAAGLVVGLALAGVGRGAIAWMSSRGPSPRSD